MQGYRVFVLLGAVVFTMPSHAQDTGRSGDGAIAEKYLTWAQKAIQEDRWAEALAGLERGMDFFDASSDLAYLLGVVRFHEGKPRAGVLEAMQQALATNQWKVYSPELGRLLEAETLIQMRRYTEALDVLVQLPPSADGICLRLRALQGMGNREAFSRVMAEALKTYSRDPRPLELLFTSAQDRQPTGVEAELMALALSRLPLLLETDQDLAYKAAPFIRDIEVARRLVGAYRGMYPGVPGSIAPALNLGLIDGRTAVDELFARPPQGETQELDKTLLQAVWKLLRTAEEQDRFSRSLSGFSGIITEDADTDGYRETQVRYEAGTLTRYTYDGDQDGLPDLTVFFEDGIPVRAELPETRGGGGSFAHTEEDPERVMVTVQWEQYPAVVAAQVAGVQYQLKPLAFFFFPLYFKRLESGGLWYPEREPFTGGIALRSLISFAASIERPSREFSGARELVDMEDGIPQRSREILDGRVVSETEFYRGRPRMQRIDLDTNGRLETRRWFQEIPDPLPEGGVFWGSVLESSESDWDGDGIFEYEERYASGQVLRLWDIDRDGTGKFSERLSYQR
ncbi:MAG: CDC27 family protein [Treponema sp.]|jgi:hypothetical protein|nr:CDC27 family protein [Treponema sp.]